MEIIQDKLLLYDPKTSLIVISKGRVVRILFEHISHVCKQGNEAVIYTCDTRYSTLLSLQEILMDLPASEFFRIHRSFIVGIKAIEKIQSDRIKVKNYWLPLSQYFKKQMIHELGKQLERDCDFFDYADKYVERKRTFNYERNTCS